MLYSNQITRFPVNLQEADTIRTLNLHSNFVHELPVDLTPMTCQETRSRPLSRQTKFPLPLRGLLLTSNNMKTILIFLDRLSSIWPIIIFKVFMSISVSLINFSEVSHKQSPDTRT